MAESRRSAPIETQFFVSGFVVVLAAILFLFLAGETASAIIDGIFKFSTNQLGALYIWFTLFCFGVELYLAFGKYGKVRFGGPDARPEFTRLSWIAMFFCACMGAALKVSSLGVAIPLMACVLIAIFPFLKWIAEDEPHLETGTPASGNP